jgi:hypothetical protein
MRRLLSLCLLAALPLFGGGPIQIRTSDLPWAVVNTPYSSLIATRVDGRCPSGDASLSLSDGALPRGLEIEGGYLQGMPKETGTFHFSVRAVNTCSSVVNALELVVTGKPVLRVFPEELSCEYRTGQAGPLPLTVQVSSPWPDLPYSIQAGAEWLVRKGGGTTPGAGSGLATDAVSLEIDPKNLAPGVYRTSVRFAAWLGANSPVVSVTLRVVAAE